MTDARAIVFLDTLEVRIFKCDLTPAEQRRKFDAAVASALSADRPHVLLKHTEHKRRARPCWIIGQTKY